MSHNEIFDLDLQGAGAFPTLPTKGFFGLFSLKIKVGLLNQHMSGSQQSIYIFYPVEVESQKIWNPPANADSSE